MYGEAHVEEPPSIFEIGQNLIYQKGKILHSQRGVEVERGSERLKEELISEGSCLGGSDKNRAWAFYIGSI